MYVAGSLIHCSGLVDPRQDFWALNHALMLTFMLPLGGMLKDKIGKRSLFISLVCFATICVITRYALGFFPYITNYVDMNYASILPLFVLAVSGSIFIVSLCKAIGHMPALEFLGRHSLLIFFLHGHFFFYKLILPRIEGTSYIVMLLFWIISIITATFIPVFISRVFDMKYLRLLKGKKLILIFALMSTSVASAQNRPVYNGDLNNDGVIDIVDITWLQRQILERQKSIKINYDSLDISSLSPKDSIYIACKDHRIIKIAVADIHTINIGSSLPNDLQNTGDHWQPDANNYDLTYITSYTHGARRSYEGMVIDNNNLYAVGSFGLRKLDYSQEETPRLVQQLQLTTNKDLNGRCIAQNDEYLYIGMRQNTPGTTYKYLPQVTFDFEQDDITAHQLSHAPHITYDLTGERCPNKGQASLKLTSTEPEGCEETSFSKNLATTLTTGEVSFWLKYEGLSSNNADIPILWHNGQRVATVQIASDGNSYSLSIDVNGNIAQSQGIRLQTEEWYNIKMQITAEDVRLLYRSKEAGDWNLLIKQAHNAYTGFDAIGFGLATKDKNQVILIDDYYFNETDLDEVSYVNGALVVVDKATMSICNKYNLDVKGTDVKVYGNMLILNCLYGCNVYRLDDKSCPVLTYTYRHPTYKEFQGIDLYHVDGHTYAFLCNYNLGYTILDVTNPDEVSIVKMDESWITHNGTSMRYGYYNFDVVIDYPYVYLTHLRSLNKQGTETDYRGIQVLDISDLNNVKRTLYTAPFEDLCIKPYGDKCPVRIERLRNSLYIDNADKGLLRFDMKGNGVLEYKGPLTIPGCQSAFNMLNDGNRRFFIAEDCYQNQPAAIHLFNVK